ncbi:Spo0E family sporulation regulatory protein-aspartic acid phosphatase [Paenibacillus ehimensis]
MKNVLGGGAVNILVADCSDEILHHEMKAILQKMDSAVQQGESLTSEYVVQLSQRLDTYVLIAQIRKMRCVS